jgi:hypothetical protein
VAIYQHNGTSYVAASRPYVKRNGVWVACEQAWVKSGGVWKQAYNVSIVPPDPPELSLEIVEDFNTVNGVKKLQTRWIKVGVRLPGLQNDDSLKLIRVLTTYAGKPPTGPRGNTYSSTPDKTFPNEPWSDWRYNQYGGHGDSSAFQYKQWTVNAEAGTTIPGDKDYYFTAWSTEDEQLWSAGTASQIHVPKDSVYAPNIITKEARIQPNSGGSWRGDGYHGGDLIQQKSPRSVGHWFYGNQFNDNFTAKPADITIKLAQIFIQRDATDSGAAAANLYPFWTTYGAVSGLPNAGTSLVKHDIHAFGTTLAKGQGKWFNIPASFWDDLKAGTIKGIGLDWKSPIKADANPDDYSRIMSIADNVRVGEIHLVWEEKT